MNLGGRAVERFSSTRTRAYSARSRSRRHRNGIRDARFVRFLGDDGTPT